MWRSFLLLRSISFLRFASFVNSLLPDEVWSRRCTGRKALEICRGLPAALNARTSSSQPNGVLGFRLTWRARGQSVAPLCLEILAYLGVEGPVVLGYSAFQVPWVLGCGGCGSCITPQVARREARPSSSCCSLSCDQPEALHPLSLSVLFSWCSVVFFSLRTVSHVCMYVACCFLLSRCCYFHLRLAALHEHHVLILLHSRIAPPPKRTLPKSYF